MEFSVVVPVCNEEKAVAPLHERLVGTLKKTGQPFEIIFVDDGSTDSTFENLQKLSPIKIIRLRRNLGQTRALAAGFNTAQGKFIISLDGDLQNDPADIPKMLRQMKEDNLDVICGWRKNRQDPLFRKLYSKAAYLLRKFLLDDQVHDAGCSLRIYTKKSIESLDLYGEMHRFIPALIAWQGFKVGEIEVAHYPRRHAKSHYNNARLIKGVLDAFNIWFWQNYSQRPLHVFGTLGIVFATLGSLFLVILAAARIFWEVPLRDRIWPLMAILSIFTGLQFFTSGLLADMLVRNRRHQKNRRPKTDIIAQIVEQ